MLARELDQVRAALFHQWFHCCITLLFNIAADLTAVVRHLKPDYLNAFEQNHRGQNRRGLSNRSVHPQCVHDSPVNINDVAVVHIPLLH